MPTFNPLVGERGATGQASPLAEHDPEPLHATLVMQIFLEILH
jgi:hypothetical protein